jgi:hypothetical protein
VIEVCFDRMSPNVRFGESRYGQLDYFWGYFAIKPVGIDREIAHAGCIACATSSGAMPTSSA